MNWEAISSIGEIVGALAVVVTLGYLAVQVKHAKSATADNSRLIRANAVRDMCLEMCRNDALRMTQTKNWGLGAYYEELAERLGDSVEEATRVDWANCYYFWMYWGQYSSTTESRDLNELEHVISGLCSNPGMKLSWETSPLNRPLLQEDFVDFVDGIVAKQSV
jgi:hypothetical protein